MSDSSFRVSAGHSVSVSVLWEVRGQLLSLSALCFRVGKPELKSSMLPRPPPVELLWLLVQTAALRLCHEPILWPRDHHLSNLQHPPHVDQPLSNDRGVFMLVDCRSPGQCQRKVWGFKQNSSRRRVTGLSIDRSLTSDPTQVFTAIFAAEMVLKILALDPYGYFQVRPLLVTCSVTITDSCSCVNTCVRLLCCHGYRLAGTPLKASLSSSVW